MLSIIKSICSLIISSFLFRFNQAARIIQLQHQLSIYQRQQPKPKITNIDRIYMVFLSKLNKFWRSDLFVVKQKWGQALLVVLISGFPITNFGNDGLLRLNVSFDLLLFKFLRGAVSGGCEDEGTWGTVLGNSVFISMSYFTCSVSNFPNFFAWLFRGVRRRE